MKKKKVLAFGTFDILHPGHVHMLKAAKKYGDHLTVVVGRDKTVCRVKGREPIFKETVRVKNLKKLNIADKVRLGCLKNKYKVISDERPDIITLGYDQKTFVSNIKNVISKDIKVVRLKPYKSNIYKSSKIRKKIEKIISEEFVE